MHAYRGELHPLRLLSRERHVRSYRSTVRTHFVADWHHDNPNDPIRIYEEVSDDRQELRKVEQFRDGRLIRTDSINDGPTTLTWEPMPDIAEIQDQSEFTVDRIGAEEFEAVWVRATDAV